MDLGMEERLIRMEAKLDLFLVAIERNRETLVDHEGRLRGVERRFWVALGFAIASLATGAGQLFSAIGGGVS